MTELTIIKIGGKVIDDAEALSQFLSDFAKIEGDKILVHGGGKIASKTGEKLGIAPKMADGRRITDSETLDLVTMVYGGLVNKKIVSGLQSYGVNALGLSGADGNLLRATKRPVKEIDYGYAGDVEVEGVNITFLEKLLKANITPVICSLTHDGEGSMLNTNADTIASIVGRAMAEGCKVDLIYCFEQKGVLWDLENEEVISEMDKVYYHELKNQGIINEGMIPKLDNAFDALKAGVYTVKIGHFDQVLELVHGLGHGTLIKNR